MSDKKRTIASLTGGAHEEEEANEQQISKKPRVECTSIEQPKSRNAAVAWSMVNNIHNYVAKQVNLETDFISSVLQQYDSAYHSIQEDMDKMEEGSNVLRYQDEAARNFGWNFVKHLICYCKKNSNL